MTEDYSNISPKGYNLEKYNNMEKKSQFQENELPKQSPKKPRPLVENVRAYVANTTLHGFRYMASEEMSLSEKLWWAIMISCSIMMCIFLIGKVWIKWEVTPVIVSFSHTSTSAWHVPFPAVTICTETKSKQRVFNVTKAYDEYHADPPTISPDDLKTLYDMLLVCNYASDRKNPKEGFEFANKSSIETMQRLAPTMEEMFLFCLWKKSLRCKDMFSHTLTKAGFCFTYNMLAEEEIFRMENLHKDYHHVTGHNKSSWTLGKGYAQDAPVDTYPRRGPSYGGDEFEVVLLTDMRDLDIVCRGPIQGFKVWLHNPAELPNMGQNFFRLPINYQSAAAVIPSVVDTSDGLIDYPPHKRNCFFPEERYLRFFKTYTQRNCDLECASNHSAYHCDCVPFYMPHGPETKVCGPQKLSCVRHAIGKLSLSKSSLDLMDLTYQDKEAKVLAKSCNCLQACMELKYDVEVSQAVYHEDAFKRHNYHEDIFRRQNDEDVASKLKLPSGLVIYFAEELFTSLQRSELYGGTDFIANCGGIMGLFMGFSFLSLIEFIYYFTVRLWCQIRKSRIVEAKK